VNTPRSDEDRLELIELTVFLLPSDEKVRVEVNDVTRLQALVDKKKVIITEASIRDALRLDDAEGIECLPNEEIFAKLARMGYEEPSTKLTFYKATSMASAVICLSTGDLSSHTTKYTSPALTRKVFANIRRVGKGFSRVETPLFEGMIVEQQVANEGDAEVNVDDIPAVGVAAEGVVSVANDEVPTAVEEPSIPSPTPPTPPPQPSQDQHLTSQVHLTPHHSPQAQPQSPQHQPQPLHNAGLPMNLLQNLMDTCTTLTRRVENLEQDKIAQALEITKLKSRVKKLERRNKASKLKRLKKVGSAQRIETSDDTVMDDVSKQGRMIADMDADVDEILEDANKEVVVEKSTDVDESADVQGRKAESQAQIYQIDLEHANKLITEVVTAASATLTAAAPQLTTAAAPTLTTAPSAARRRKEVVIRDPQKSAKPSTIIHSEAKSKDKGKGILVEEPKPLKKQAQIEQDEAYVRELKAELNKNIDWDKVIDHVQRKQKEDNAVKRYQALKRKPQSKAQAKKNMMIYLRNVASFKMDYFKGMSYDDVRPIFEKHFDSNVAFLQKKKEQMDEEDSKALKRMNESQEDKAAKNQKLDEEVEELKRHLQIVPDDEDDVYTEATPLALKVPVVDYEIYNEHNKPYFKIKRADGSHQLYLSFMSMLRNFDREDLEALWRLVKERFATTKPKNFSDDFLLITLGAMFEKLDI
nr:hypothetical protein [Tanacetum cinerariifolium]